MYRIHHIMFLSALVGFFTHQSSTGMEPPDKGDLEKYTADGSIRNRLAMVERIGNHRVRKDVGERTLAKLELLAGKRSLSAPLPAWAGMPTTGTNNILVFLIDFPDYSHVNTQEVITNKLFGSGTPSEFPRESLRNYYLRSSYNQLFLQGTALGWYTMAHPRSWYTTTYGDGNAANRAVIQEVVSAFDASQNFSIYDNNNDGEIDYFAIIWAGPDNGWGNFWWGYQWELETPVVADGKQFVTFSWQWESRPVGSAFEAETIIHETGHALGLPDYYDYDDSVGPQGGVGGHDMMDGNWGDHCAFSKFMLDWITPTVISSGSSNVLLRALSTQPEAVAIMPQYSGATPYSEYFMIENRYRIQNDTGWPSDGFLVWHIDATPNALNRDFLYDNSYTTHKLLRLMEADGLEEIETGDGKADAGDYYNQGESFSPSTTPNSQSYAGSNTYVTVQSISANGTNMTAAFSITSPGTGPVISRSPATLTQSLTTNQTPSNMTFEVWNSGSGSLVYNISENAGWLTLQAPTSGVSAGGHNTHTISVQTSGLTPGLSNAVITISSTNALNSPQVIEVTLFLMGGDLGQATDAADLTWATGGHSLWYSQSSVSYDGEDAAQSGLLSDRQTNWLQTSVTGPGTLTYWWKVSSEANYDFLRFLVDGIEQPGKISGNTDWQQVSKTISNGSHTVRWAYTKDSSVAGGADAGWLDQVSFVSNSVKPLFSYSPTSFVQTVVLESGASTRSLEVWNSGGGTLFYSISDNGSWLTISPTNEASSGGHNQHTLLFNVAGLGTGTYSASLTLQDTNAVNSPRIVPVTLQVILTSGLGESLETPSWTWTQGGQAAWTPQTLVTHDGVDAARSGPIGHLQSSIMETIVQGPGTLTFWGRVSSEPNYDFLRFAINSIIQSGAISGESGWQQFTYAVPEGPCTLQWEYSKDTSATGGQDAAWVDQIAFTREWIALQNILYEDFSVGLPAGWSIVDYSGTGAGWSFNNACARSNFTGGAGPFAMVDSDCLGFYYIDTELRTPAFSLQSLTNASLSFGNDIYVYSSNELFTVTVSVNGGDGTPIWQHTHTNLLGPTNLTVNLTPYAGQTNVVIGFRYSNAYYDYWWQIDNVHISGWRHPDSNSNSVPDAWEFGWFGSLTNVTAVSDFDHDGQCDRDEYTTGTDPTDGSSWFGWHPAQTPRAQSSGMLLQWSSVSNRIYRIQRATNLATGFLTIRTNPATPTLNVYTDTTAIGRGPYLYRLDVQNP